MPATPVKSPANKSPAKGTKKQKNVQKSPKAKKSKKQAKESKDMTLFEVTSTRGTAMATVVSDWIERYNEDKEAAALELVNYVIEVAGTNLLVSPETFAEGDVDDAMEQLEKEKAQEESDYPVVSKKKDMKKFKNAFLDFWKKLIDKCKNSIIFDDYLLDTCFAWFVGISGAELRALRHTVTLAVLQIITSLATVATEIRKELDSVQRIQGGEKKSASQKAGSLAKKAGALNDKIVKIEENLIGDLFKDVYTHRFRDTFPDIRASCVDELGTWVNRYPVLFLNDTYLKYIGWTLNDRVADVRANAVKVLAQRLFNDNEHVSQLQMFTQRFKPRMIEIAEADSEASVQIQGISLLTEMSRLDLLEEEEKEKVYRLVGHENAKVRDAVGAFIFENVLREGDDQISQLSGKASKKGSEKLLEIQKKQLVSLVDFILEYHPIPDMPHYVVDALWGKCSLLKEWAAMAAVVNDPSEFATEEHQNVLIGLVNAAIHKALDKKIVDLGIPEENTETKQQAKVQKSIEENQLKFTRDFVENIADLLETHKGDAAKLGNLLELVLFFGTTTVIDEHQQKVIEKVLDVVKEIFFINTSESVQTACTRLVKHFSDSTELASHAVKVREAMVKEVMTKLKACNPKSKKSKSVDGFELVAALQRLQQLLLLINVPAIERSKVENPVLDILQGLAINGNGAEVTLEFAEDEDGKLRERSIILGLTVTFQIAAWKLLAVRLKRTTEDIEELVALRDDLIKQLSGILHKYVEYKGKDEGEVPEEDRFSDAVAEKAYMLSCDFMVLFSTNIAKGDDDDDLYPVCLKKNLDDLQKKVVGYFEDAMFTEDGLLNERDIETELEKEADKQKAKEAKAKKKAEEDDEEEEEEEEEEDDEEATKGKKGKKGKGKAKAKKGKGKAKEKSKGKGKKASQKEKEPEAPSTIDASGLDLKKEKIQSIVLALSRAIRFGAMPWSEATQIIRVYAYTPVLSKAVNDVIKELLHVAREHEAENEWRYAYSALVLQYELVLKEREGSLKKEVSTLPFLRFKELCLKLSLTYGLVATKSKALAHLVWEGAFYALNTDENEDTDRVIRYSFLLGLNYFSSRLPYGEARAVVKRFQEESEKLTNKPSEDNADDTPYFSFLENLRKKAKVEATTPKSTGGKKSVAGGKKRKANGKNTPQGRKLQYDEEEGEEEEQQEEEEGEEEELADQRTSKRTRKQDTENEEEGEAEEEGSQKKPAKRKSLDSQEGPRKRGRPKKNTEGEEEEAEKETPKRRGRPKKKAAEAEEEGEEEEAEQEEAEEEPKEAPKKRGRPKKQEVEEENGEQENEEEAGEEEEEETTQPKGKESKKKQSSAKKPKQSVVSSQESEEGGRRRSSRLTPSK